jgi:hypothetical protein
MKITLESLSREVEQLAPVDQFQLMQTIYDLLSEHRKKHARDYFISESKPAPPLKVKLRAKVKRITRSQP